MIYEFINKEKYIKNKDYYINLINEMYKDDDNSLADVSSTKKHLDFIFLSGNNAFLIFQINNNELIAMVNFFEYNNLLNEWCLFLLFTNKKYRNQGHAFDILKYSLTKLKDYKCNKLISGIEPINTNSIKLHEKIGFRYTGLNWNQIDSSFPNNHLAYIYEDENIYDV